MSIYTFINPAINVLLRSPWHRRLSKRVMTVIYNGRRSGKRFNTPISYYRSGDKVYCFTNGAWRHNFSTEAAATLRLAGSDYKATGKLFDGDHERQVNVMSAYFRTVPQDRKFYGVTADAGGNPIRSQVEQALRSIVIVEFTL